VFTYNPSVFEVQSIPEAAAIILTPEGGQTTQERWGLETEYLSKLIEEKCNLNEHSLVIDYGCGLGRVAKELIDLTGCRVIGVDTSASMRTLAMQYNPSPRFTAIAPEMLESLRPVVDAVICIWTLQHIPKLDDVIDTLAKLVGYSGSLLVLNNQRRAVPVNCGWFDDGLDVKAQLNAQFGLPTEEGVLPLEATSKLVSENTFWAVWGN
jgi:2-polyprenyl-3-methyl-5-hydroxy-6-metoxy-1,4-benzoquinol methylase